ncbi:hypothetical protein MKEN_00559500 [Mycena kentingensis (nom. inval.)]|nr:hypothetical protein MKEN_00559500 [Mycena kentingensis (nom. inval.)]
MDTPQPAHTQLTPTLQDTTMNADHDSLTPPASAGLPPPAAGKGGYFGRTLLQRRMGPGASADDRDETGSTVTNLSTRAEAGSLAPTPPFSPMDESGPFFNAKHDDAPMGEPPEIQLEPRRYPLGRDGAEAILAPGASGDAPMGGGVGAVPLSAAALEQLDREAAEDGDREPRDEMREWMEEDAYSSDENAPGADTKAKRVKAKMKVLGGKVTANPGLVEEGKKALGQ